MTWFAAWARPWLLMCVAVGGLAGPVMAQTARSNDDPWPAIRADYLAGDYAGASVRLEQLVHDDATSREGWYYLGLIRWRQGDVPGAAEAYRVLWRLDPNGAFGKEAKLFLDAYASRGLISPVEAPTPAPRRAVVPLRPATPAPSARVTTTVMPLPRATPSPRPSLPRARSARPRPGYFKAADGTYEFKPPQGFVLLDEGLKGEEAYTLFGAPGALTRYAAGKTPPTLLITWRELPELAGLRPDQRAAREQQVLKREAGHYGPEARPGAYAGGPCLRIHQAQGDWAADTLVFVQQGRLYAMTYGGDAQQLGSYRKYVDEAWRTAIFNP